MDNKLRAPLTQTAIAYAWRQLAQRAGVKGSDASGNGFESLKIPVHYASSDQLALDRAGLIVMACSDSAWQSLLERAPNSLNRAIIGETIPPGGRLNISETVPVLFWGAGYEDGRMPFVKRREDGSVVFYADIIAATLFMLSRWEEMAVSVRDQHERFPASASVAYRQGFLDQPIIDEYSLILREWLKVLIPNWLPNARRFSIKLTHDIDSPYIFSNKFSAARVLGGDLIKRRSLRNAWSTAKMALRDPHVEGIHTLAELSRAHEMDSAFFFMAAEPSQYEVGYDPESPLVRKCIEGLKAQGFEIGLHPSYYTLNNPHLLEVEKTRLDGVLGEACRGGRQHYLRFHVPNTWRHWEEVGLDYDSTMGYADVEGFRCGTCHPFQPFDLERNRELRLWEQPLIVMDVTLRLYRNLLPEQGQARICELVECCRRVEGTFTLLWHNSSLGHDWCGWREVYQQLLEQWHEGVSNSSPK